MLTFSSVSILCLEDDELSLAHSFFFFFSLAHSWTPIQKIDILSKYRLRTWPVDMRNIYLFKNIY